MSLVSSRFSRSLAFLALALFVAGTICSLSLRAQDSSSSSSSGSGDSSDPVAAAAKEEAVPAGKTKLKIIVTNASGSPVGNASVYVRYPKNGKQDNLQELDFKTNQDGSVKVPPVPIGKIQVQVIAKGWHTFGEWYDVENSTQTVNFQLQEPPHWY
jgi:hypothetical protein